MSQLAKSIKEALPVPLRDLARDLRRSIFEALVFPHGEHCHEFTSKHYVRRAFDGDPEVPFEIEKLVDRFGIKTIIETGTNIGSSTRVLSRLAPRVVTIELHEEYHQLAKDNLRDCPNVECLQGNSPDILKRILPYVEQPVLFFLDAHWDKYWPVCDELSVIAKVPQCVNSVIAVHDFHVPGTRLRFEKYHGQKLDLSYIQPFLDQINPEFGFYYNHETPLSKIGLIYVFPQEHMSSGGYNNVQQIIELRTSRLRA